MAHIVAIANQKGGVGKTTTAVNLAASLAIAERRTLLLDADPQGNATSGLGVAKLELELSLYDAMVDDRPAREVVLPVSSLPHLSVLPATQDLVGAELQLVEREGRERALRKVIEQLEGDYDYIVVDCPPSLGLLTLNVLAASHAVLIPIQCEYYGLEGISQLLNTVRLVQQNFNPGLAISGVLLTMYDARLNLCRQVAEDAKEYFGAKMFLTAIPRNVRLAEAPSFGKPILLYDVQSVGAKSYIAVAQELMRRVENSAGAETGARVADIEEIESLEKAELLEEEIREPAATEGAADVAKAHAPKADAPKAAAANADAAKADAAKAEAEKDDTEKTESVQADVANDGVANAEVAKGERAQTEASQAKEPRPREAESRAIESDPEASRAPTAIEIESESRAIEPGEPESRGSEPPEAEPKTEVAR